jgi:hypothetical protein
VSEDKRDRRYLIAIDKFQVDLVLYEEHKKPSNYVHPRSIFTSLIFSFILLLILISSSAKVDIACFLIGYRKAC